MGVGEKYIIGYFDGAWNDQKLFKCKSESVCAYLKGAHTASSIKPVKPTCSSFVPAIAV